MQTDSTTVATLLTEMTDEGSWPTIDYTDRIRGQWPVKKHLAHVQSLAIAYRQPESPWYGKASVSEKIHSSLNYWLKNDFLSTNWWDQHIGVPELLAPTLFLMEKELSQKQLDQALVLLRRAKIKMSGQNKVWLSGNVLMRSLLTRDIDSVAMASAAIQGELRIADGVGLKSDWSYHEHGAQIQLGLYGMSYLEDMIKWYTLVDGTDFRFSEDKKVMLRNYLLEGQQWVIYKQQMDISASGRQIWLDEQGKKYQQLKRCLEQMALLDEDYAPAYADAIDSETLEGNKHFWKSDFQVHRRKDFYFSLKMSSERVVGTESVNEENIRGYYLGDGVSLLYTDTEAYTNVAPFWDWKKLPGTTVVQDDEPLPVTKSWDFETNSTFVGGVTDGRNGIATLSYDRDGVQALKSWFMFDDQIICLGSGITTARDFPLTTAVDQVFMKGPISYGKNGEVRDDLKVKERLNPDWLLHDDTGYLFPKSEGVYVLRRFLEGSWHNTTLRYRPVILTETTLSIWFDHGTQPTDATYEYVLVPNATEERLVALTADPAYLITNEKSRQVVVSKDGSRGGVVFYEPGSADVLGGIAVDRPCIVLFKKVGTGVELTVSDPSQKLTELTISLREDYTDGEEVRREAGTSVTVALPQGGDAGRSTSVRLAGGSSNN
ncbi:chondroitin AC lyase [Lewinella antarctica]|uniref:Chondroitin AC lyase n=2 Tax=Neolewinella antarctica TaxID=442734 RepID=A0ABX0XG44_9BACT|nr:chondroitin AC lyase [Neolewinella antarctica]